MAQQTQNISVIGAGIMGVMNAYVLQRTLPNANITLYDPQGFPAKNASYIAGGMIAPLSELDHMPVEFLDAGYESIALWTEISKTFSNNIGFTSKGSLFLSHKEDRHLLERFKTILPDTDDWHVANEQDIQTLEPSISKTCFKSGLYMKREAHLDPRKTLIALLSNIKNKRQEAITLYEHQESVDWVIDCRGIKTQDTKKDLRGVKGEVIVVHNPDFHLSRPIRLMHPRYPLYIVPRENNTFLIGATIIESNSTNEISIRSAMELMSALYSLDRSFGDAEVLEMNAKPRPSYSDNLPQISQHKNVIYCNGLYRHGFLFAPIIAQCVSKFLTGQEYPFTPLFWKEKNDHNISERKQLRA